MSPKPSQRPKKRSSGGMDPNQLRALQAPLTESHQVIAAGLTHYNVFSLPPFAAAALAFLDDQPG